MSVANSNLPNRVNSISPLPPPPAPVGYISRPQQGWTPWQPAATTELPSSLPSSAFGGAQLEKPSGYSYDSPTSAYTTHLQAPNIKKVPVGASQFQQQQQQSYLNYLDNDEHQQQPNKWQLPRQRAYQAAAAAAAPSLPNERLDHYMTSAAASRSTAQAAQLKPPPPASSVLPTSSSSISTNPLSTNPCKPAATLGGGGHLFVQQQNEQTSSNNDLLLAAASEGGGSVQQKYVRVGEATRLRSQFIFKVLRADSLTDCELACTRASLHQALAPGQPSDSCRSFNYRPYFAAENCELSRYDTKTSSLKLDDSAHFEQNTQFDFYSLVEQQQQQPVVSAAALFQQQQQQQQIDLSLGGLGGASGGAAGQQSECLDVAQSCSQDGMEFTLRTSEPFNGRIYTYGFYDSCYFDGDQSTTSVLKISRSNGFPRCGTQQIGDLMTNIVVVQFNDHVQTTRDKKYNLTCYFSGPGEAVVTSNYLDTKIDERSHPIQIEHLPPQNVITSNVHLRVLYRGQPTNNIAVGDLLTFRLETSDKSTTTTPGGHSKSGHHQLARQMQLLEGTAGAGRDGVSSIQQQQQHEIFATNVIAKDPYSGKQVQLIDSRGCPVDAMNVFPELQRTPDGALESEFYAFKIPDSNFLIFQATVRTCKAPCEPVICQTSSGNHELFHHHHHGQSPSSIRIKQPVAGGGGAALAPVTSAAIKSGASLGAYLMAPHSSSAPSWGKRRRRRQTDAFDSDVSSSSESNSELDSVEGTALAASESVEHIIPVRINHNNNDNNNHHDEIKTTSTIGDNDNNDEYIHRQTHKQPVVTRVKRPDFSEPEEEVKEMFRVYMSRAEMNKQQRQRQTTTTAASTTVSTNPDIASIESFSRENESQPPLIDNNNNIITSSNNNNNEAMMQTSRTLSPDDQSTTTSTARQLPICLAQATYYVMLFSLIALSLVICSVLVVAMYLTRKGKFYISEALADSIF